MKENVPPEMMFSEPLGISKKMNVKTSGISNLSNDIEAEKEYLSKLKIQRQKTEKLHSEYVKLKKEKDSLKDDYETQMSSLNRKISDHECELDKKSAQTRELVKQVQKLKSEGQRYEREKNDSLNKLKSSYEETFLDLKQNIQNLTETIESKNKTINSLKKNHQAKIKQLESEALSMEEKNKMNQEKVKASDERFKETERILIDWEHKCENQEFELNRLKIENQMKSKESNGLKTTIQRFQMENQSLTRKNNHYQDQLTLMSDKISQLEREKEKLKEKNEELGKELSSERVNKSKLETIIIQKQGESTKLRQEINRKEETIKQCQNKILNLEGEQQWKERLTEKQNENEELLEAIKTLKEENYSLMNFIKQRQVLERERRSLMENEMEEITKFQHLLRDVN